MNVSAIEEKRLRQIINKNPEDLSSQFRLGVLLEESGKYDEAQREYSDIIEKDPNFNNAFSHLKNLHHMKDDEPYIIWNYSTVLWGPSPIIDNSSIIPDSVKWDVLKKDRETLIIPFNSKYSSLLTIMDQSERIALRNLLESEKYKYSGILTMNRSDEYSHITEASELSVELGEGYREILGEIFDKRQVLCSKFFKETGINLPFPEISISRDIPDNRYRILMGCNILSQGGFKKDHVFVIVDRNRAYDCFAGFNSYNENLQVFGRWIHKELISKAQEEGLVIVDDMTQLLESLYFTQRINLFHIWDINRTERLLHFMKKNHPNIPWKKIESRISQKDINRLLKNYIRDGGSIKNSIIFFEKLADHIEESDNLLGIYKYIYESVINPEELKETMITGNNYAFNLSPAIEESILNFSINSENIISDQLINLPQILMQIEEISERIRDSGKIPILICKPENRPIIREYTFKTVPDLRILSYDDIARAIGESGHIHPESVQLIHEIKEDYSDFKKTEERISREIQFLHITPAEISQIDSRTIAVASLMKDGRRQFLYLPGVIKNTGDSIRKTLVDYQQRGYFLEGIFNISYQENDFKIHLAERDMEFSRNYIITIEMGYEIINKLNRCSNLKSRVASLRESIHDKYGIQLPEILFHHNPVFKPNFYEVFIGTEIIHRSSLHTDSPLDEVASLLIGNLSLLIEKNIEKTIDYDMIENYINKNGFCESIELSKKESLSKTIKEVARELLEEKVSLKNSQIILNEIIKQADDSSSSEIAENIRLIVRDEIIKNLESKDGKIRVVSIEPEMEIILSSSFFSLNEADPLPMCANGETEYIAQYIKKEYKKCVNENPNIPIICSRFLRRAIRNILKYELSDTPVIAKEELSGYDTIVVNSINASLSIRKYFIDELLKQGILNNYEEQEQNALKALKICTNRTDEIKGSLEKDLKKTSLFFEIELGRLLGEFLDSQKDELEFSCFTYFLKEWLSCSTRRNIPDIKVTINDYIKKNSFNLRFEGFFEHSFEFPEEKLYEIKRKKIMGVSDLFGSLNINWMNSPKGSKILKSLHNTGMISFNPLEIILLLLFSAMKNLHRFYDLIEPLEKNIIEEANRAGINNEKSAKILYELASIGVNPLCVQDAFLTIGQELSCLGEDAIFNRIIEYASMLNISSVCSKKMQINAIILSSEIESFLSGYTKEISPEILYNFKPVSLINISQKISEELTKLMDNGFSPVVYTMEIDKRYIYKLIERSIPQVTVIGKKDIPPGISIKPFSTIKEDDIYDNSFSIDNNNHIFSITEKDFYLFCALLSDHRGDFGNSSLLYDRILDIEPLFTTALWRGAFCWQRMGDKTKALNMRKKALLYFKRINFAESGYYKPDKKNWEQEFKLQKLRNQKKNNNNMSDYRLGYLAYQKGKEDIALKNLKRSLLYNKFDDEIYSTLAHLMSERESYDEALKLYKDALTLNPWNYEAQQGLGKVYLEKSDFEKSQNIYRRLLKIDPDNLDLLQNLGFISRDKDDCFSAIGFADAIIKCDQENAMAFFLRSQAYHGLGRIDKEIFDLKEALRIDPDSLFYNRTIGNAYWTVCLFEDALKYYKCVFSSPENSSYKPFHKIKILMSLGDYSTCYKIIKEIISKDSLSSTMQHLMGEICMKTGHLDEARESFTKAHGMNPTNLIYDISLADILGFYGERTKPEKIYKRVLAKNPGWASIYLKLAAIYIEKKDLKTARNLLKTGMGWAPGYTDLYLLYFSIMESEEELQQWHKRFKERLSMDCHNYLYYLCLGLIENLSQRQNNAIEELERAYIQAPESPQTVEYLCRLYMMDKDIEKSLVILRVALKKLLRAGRLHFLEGMCWKIHGNNSRAKDRFLKSSNCDPLMPYSCIAGGYASLIDDDLEKAEKEAVKALNYNNVFGPAFLLLSEIYKTKDLIESQNYLNKAKESNPLDMWGII